MEAGAAALVVVGAMMVTQIREIDMSDFRSTRTPCSRARSNWARNQEAGEPGLGAGEIQAQHAGCRGGRWRCPPDRQKA